MLRQVGKGSDDWGIVKIAKRNGDQYSWHLEKYSEISLLKNIYFMLDLNHFQKKKKEGTTVSGFQP